MIRLTHWLNISATHNEQNLSDQIVSLFNARKWWDFVATVVIKKPKKYLLLLSLREIVEEHLCFQMIQTNLVP